MADISFLTPDEWHRFLDAIIAPRDRAMFLVAYWRGLRASEIGLLTRDSVDLARGRITVRRLKGSFGGEYKLSEQEQKALKVWLKVRGEDPGPLFLSRKKSGPIARAQIFHLFRRYADRAGLPQGKRHPHILKHSIATHLLAAGFGIMDVKDWLGHMSVNSTTVYARVTNERRNKVAEGMDRWSR